MDRCSLFKKIVLTELQKLLNDERGACYVGGTLDMPISDEFGCCLNVSGRSFLFQIGGQEREIYSDEILKLTRKAYLKFKNPSSDHPYYSLCQE